LIPEIGSFSIATTIKNGHIVQIFVIVDSISWILSGPKIEVELRSFA
jgi:hypothetical protein